MNIKNILAPYIDSGRPCYILLGRSIYDSEPSKDNHITSLVRQIAEYAYHKLNMIVIRYSLSEGLSVPYPLIPNREERKLIKNTLTEAGIIAPKCNSGSCSANQDLISLISGIKKLAVELQAAHKFIFLFEYAGNLFSNGNSKEQKAVNEMLCKLANDRKFEASGNIIILSDSCEARIDENILKELLKHYIPQPNKDEKVEFLAALTANYPGKRYADNLDDNMIANLTAGTPNKGLECMFKSQVPITAAKLIEQKTKDISQLSEGTCVVLDASEARNVKLVGRNIQVASNYLRQQARGLANGDKTTARNIILCGAPGTGKTILAKMMAMEASAAILELVSPKDSFVGGTERKVRLQTRILNNMSPVIGFIDEITEAMPTQRTDNLDSGASDSILQAYLAFMSDDNRRGRSILLATSNCPTKLGAAFSSRTVCVPLLMPTITDMPAILVSIIQEKFGIKYDCANEGIQKAAEIFYGKHLMPREIHKVLEIIPPSVDITPRTIVEAAIDAMSMSEDQWRAAVHADLTALYYTASKQLLPWYGCDDYVFPDYIRNVMDEDREIDSTKLYNEIQRLKPYANV